VLLEDAETESLLALRGPHAVDARGRVLSSHFELRDGLIAIVVDYQSTTYPITSDPIFVNENIKLTSDQSPPQALFSDSFDMLGSRAAVGAPGPARRGKEQSSS
jgi:hypothetical protein